MEYKFKKRSKEQREYSERLEREYEKYGLNILPVLDCKVELTEKDKDRIKALQYIVNEQKIPEDLEKRILRYKYEDEEKIKAQEV